MKTSLLSKYELLFYYRYKTSFAWIFFLLMILFSNLLMQVKGLYFTNYLDELLLGFFLLGVTFERKIKPTSLYVIGSIIYFILISILTRNSPVPSIILQSVIHLKLFIFVLLLDRFVNLKNLKITIRILFTITLIGLILNIILQTSFNSFFSISDLYRTGLLRINGFQLSSNNLGLTVVLFFISFLFRQSSNTYSALFATFLTLLILIFIGSRTSILGVLVALFFWVKEKNVSFKIIVVLISFVMVPVVFNLLAESDLITRTISNVEMVEEGSNSGYVRGIMIYHSFHLFFNYFPIGSGAASYGTVLSEGSKIYDQLGLSSVTFFKEMSGVYDSNWASIIGEFGLIGIMIFLKLLLETYSISVRKIKVSMKPPISSIFVIIILSAITMPVFMNGYSAMIFSLFIVYLKKSSVTSGYLVSSKYLKKLK